MVLNIKNMTGKCCMFLAKKQLQQAGYDILAVKPSFIEIKNLNPETDTERINSLLSEFDMSVIQNPELTVIERIKQAVFELIHEMNNVSSIAEKSEYLVEKLRLSTRQISQLFTKYEPVTLERYIILQKMERVKQLILKGEFTLSEIAYMMDYSSVQYLSTQFKKEIGMSFTEFKESVVKQ